MATNIPPHNLREVAAALAVMIVEARLDVNGLMKHVKGPDADGLRFRAAAATC